MATERSMAMYETIRQDVRIKGLTAAMEAGKRRLAVRVQDHATHLAEIMSIADRALFAWMHQFIYAAKEVKLTGNGDVILALEATHRMGNYCFCVVLDNQLDESTSLCKTFTIEQAYEAAELYCSLLKHTKR